MDTSLINFKTSRALRVPITASLMDHAHTILQPAKDEMARAQDRVPMPATFVRAPAAPRDAESSPQPPTRSPAPAPSPLDGYVEA